MKALTEEDLQHLAIGCAVLGSGGGGNPDHEVLMAKHAVDQHGPISLIELEELKEDDFILPVGVIGAPLVALEKLRSGREFLHIVELVEKSQGRKVTVFMPVEIGGANGFAAFSIATQLGLPVLNADLMGRAFPELQMTSCTVVNVPASPAFLADSLGNSVMIKARNAKELENIARHVTVSMGSSCAIAFCLMDSATAKRTVIPSTLTQAIEIGHAVSEAKKRGEEALKPLLEITGGAYLGRGTIVSVEQSVQNGFLQGNVHISGEEGTFKVFYQNEYLLVQKEGKSLACTPDILMLVEEASGTPITAESLRYGLKVSVIALPAPAIWKTEKGLKLVGPECFGYKGGI